MKIVFQGRELLFYSIENLTVRTIVEVMTQFSISCLGVICHIPIIAITSILLAEKSKSIHFDILNKNKTLN